MDDQSLNWKSQEVHLSASLSPVAKCLSAFNRHSHRPTIAWPHRSSFFMTTVITDSDDRSNPKDVHKDTDDHTDYVTQVKCLQFNSSSCIVVASHIAIRFYSETRDLILEHSFPSNVEQSSLQLLATGIACLSSLVAVSTNDGSILMFEVQQNGQDLKVTSSKFHQQITPDRPITDLVSDGNCQLGSAHECGSVLVWDVDIEHQLKQSISFTSPEQVPCICLALYKNYLCAGYGSGHLRIFDVLKKALVCEISAHAKWVTAMDVALQTGLLLTTSEDSFVRVWQIGQENDSIQVRHVFSESVTNHMLFGGVFLDEKGKGFCVGGYDSTVLHHFICQ